MAMDSERHAVALEGLSALLDGELDDGSISRACSHWRESSEARASWHAYHLIGDVLRCDDLACDPGHDAVFLQAFRSRLVSEPVVLAPRSLGSAVADAARAKGARWSWLASSAVAAGFVAVAGVVLVTRAPGSSADGRSGVPLAQVAPAPLAAAPMMADETTLASTPRPAPIAGEPQTFVADGKLIRDARLDRYLQAHHEFAGSSALGVPSVFLRSATATANSIDR